MKKALKALLILSLFSLAFVFASCGSKAKSTSDSKSTDVTLTEEEKEYTYTFYNEDGTEVLKTETIKEGNNILPPTDPEKESTETNSFDFIGWYTQKEGGEKVTSFENIKSNVTLYARFNQTVKKYKITWLLDDDTPIDTTKVEVGGTPSHDAPSKSATKQYSYTFLRWTPEITEVSGDQTYKAVFEETLNKYTYTFYNEDGTQILKEETKDYGSSIVLPTENPTKTKKEHSSFEFVGWYTASGKEYNSNDTLNDNISYYAKFEEVADKYTYTFYDYDGTTEIKKLTVDYGTEIIPPSDPADYDKNGYNHTFIGWADGLNSTNYVTEFGKIESNVSYYAKYDSTPNKYTYTFYDEDKKTIIKQETVEYLTYISAPKTNPTKDSNADYTYTFAYWKDEQGLKVTSFNWITKDTYFYAYYTEAKTKYTITFDTQGGTKFDPYVREWGQAVYAPTKDPVRPGYKFEGWDKELPEYMPKENITITAIWSKENYKVSVVNNTTFEYTVSATNAEYGQKIYLSVKNSGNYTIQWSRSDNTTITYTGIDFSFNMPTNDVTITITGLPYTIKGNTVTFGSYPQSREKKSDILQDLNSMIGSRPTATELNGWTAYQYYSDSNISKYMFYKDITYGSSKYRAVYMTNYRPTKFSGYALDSASPTNSQIDDNGFSLRYIYYFKFEPIVWTISVNDNGEARLLANMVLDSQAYCNSESQTAFTHNGLTNKANSYVSSDIRVWLNADFYNTAFNADEKATILKSLYVPANTTLKDNVGLFKTSDFNDNVKIAASGTDYAKIQGLSSGYYTASHTTVSGDSATYVSIGKANGSTGTAQCFYTSIGVRPSVTIQLS